MELKDGLPWHVSTMIMLRDCGLPVLNRSWTGPHVLLLLLVPPQMQASAAAYASSLGLNPC